MKKVINVVVGVLKAGDQFLITRRQAFQDFANHWEFPGGKVELDEAPQDALIREFAEEVGIVTSDWTPLIEIPWDYDHKTVHLKVYQTKNFSGEASGREGQNLRWATLEELAELSFPQANQGILSALRLPDIYMISGDFSNLHDGLQRLRIALDDGVRFLQLRPSKNLDEALFLAFAREAVALSHEYDAICLLNGKPDWLEQVPDADGIQLASSKLMDWVTRPIPKDKWLGVSTHCDLDIAKALELGADFILLSPVMATTSHPELPGLGWSKFGDYCTQIPVPVYALGGMKPSDSSSAIKSGGQGVATTLGLWPQSL